MFTGIIEIKTDVISHNVRDEITTLELRLPDGWIVRNGQSIAINGVCLTVVKFDEKTFTVEMMQETLDKTTFGSNIPVEVNLERAMRADDRFEGHIVQGHVDIVGTLSKVEKGKETSIITISYEKDRNNLVVDKGSITVDGVSLTVINPTENAFSIALIPHTLRETTLGELTEGDGVNLEFDIIGKYITKSN